MCSSSGSSSCCNRKASLVFSQQTGAQLRPEEPKGWEGKVWRGLWKRNHATCPWAQGESEGANPGTRCFPDSPGCPEQPHPTPSGNPSWVCGGPSSGALQGHMRFVRLQARQTQADCSLPFIYSLHLRLAHTPTQGSH